MDIALIGYGKMGKAIEQTAIERGHQIVLKINSNNQSAFTESNLQMANVAIEFTQPDSAFDNVIRCLSAGLPIVCGTTGWEGKIKEAQTKCLAHNGSFLQTSNFSIGVNLFFELNCQLAKIMNLRKEYDVSIKETHHLEKKDKPSGTAITLANQIISQISTKNTWQLEIESKLNKEVIPITSYREEGVAGIHNIAYRSEIDDIEIKHTAHSRKGFALGAVLSAEFIHNKQGIFTMRDVINLI